MKRLVSVIAILLTQNARAESGIKYWYSELKSDFTYYTGARTKDAKVKVHEFSISDASGELSAGLQTVGNRMAAEAGAINAERQKIEKGESLGGPKTLTYTYERAQARSGDAKIYSLRLGSTENAFSMETLSTNRNKHEMVTYAEIAMVAPVLGDILFGGDWLAARYDLVFGGRWGGIRVNDLNAQNDSDKYKNAGYLYLPLSYRMTFFLPFGFQALAEYGVDPITVVRHYGDRQGEKIPLDHYMNAAVEFRYEFFGVGLQYEKYRGSAVTKWGESIVNPAYQHEMLGVYAVLGM
jgi:hypothetical protein